MEKMEKTSFVFIFLSELSINESVFYLLCSVLSLYCPFSQFYDPLNKKLQFSLITVITLFLWAL